jgi:colicin import membrane protein
MEPNQPNEQELKRKRYVTVSFVLHILFFLSFTVGSYFAPKTMTLSPSVQIDMVALPDQLKNQQQPDVDMTKPVKENPPPAPPPEPEPEAKKPEPVAEPEKPSEPDPDLMALEKEKQKLKKKKIEDDAKKRAADALKKMKEQAKKEQEAEEQKRREALDKRKQDLKAFEEAYRKAQRGNQKNSGDSATGEVNQGVLDAYQSHMLSKIRANWGLPAFLQGKNLRATIRMHLDARGNVIKMEFTKVSGNNMFDGYAEGAIRQASPFAPPPAELAPRLKSEGVEVAFPI